MVALKELANEIFGESRLEVLKESHVGWPTGANAMFWHAAEYIHQFWPQYFLWIESDCIPMIPGWMDALSVAWCRNLFGRGSEVLFLGDIYDAEIDKQPHLPAQIMSGIAVYPPNAATILKRDKPAQAWDMENAELMVSQGVHTNLVRHRWGMPGLPPTFVETITVDSPINAFTPEMIRPECVLFHRNKDGSLIRLLDEKFFPKEPDNGKADVVSLRRNGDIICLLPALHGMSLSMRRPVRLVVHNDFVPLLDGVSYVEPVPWHGSWEEPLTAAAKHRACNAQVFGQGLAPDTFRENFAMLAWKKVGIEWNRHHPLEFDQRDLHREAGLASAVFKTGKPKILLKLHGYSSPFPHEQMVREMLSVHFSDKAEVVDLDKVKAHRIYDLIGLMDRAACLVSVDTCALWLAHASKVPLVGFVNGTGFAASPPRGNQILRMDYREVPSRMTQILAVMENTLEPEGNDSIVLCFSHFIPNDQETKRRQNEAYETWPLLGARMFSHEPPVHRTSASVGDPRMMPFVRDMIDGAFKSGTEDILVITNNDIKFDPELRQDIIESCKDWGCWWAYRTEFHGAKTDNGADVFAMTRKWWKIHQHLFPDLLLGYWWWDDIMCRIMVWSGCHEQKRLYYHEPHAGASPTRQHAPGAVHNDAVAMQWLRQHWERRQKVYET